MPRRSNRISDISQDIRKVYYEGSDIESKDEESEEQSLFQDGNTGKASGKDSVQGISEVDRAKPHFVLTHKDARQKDLVAAFGHTVRVASELVHKRLCDKTKIQRLGKLRAACHKAIDDVIQQVGKDLNVEVKFLVTSNLDKEEQEKYNIEYDDDDYNNDESEVGKKKYELVVEPPSKKSKKENNSKKKNVVVKQDKTKMEVFQNIVKALEASKRRSTENRTLRAILSKHLTVREVKSMMVCDKGTHSKGKKWFAELMEGKSLKSKQQIIQKYKPEVVEDLVFNWILSPKSVGWRLDWRAINDRHAKRYVKVPFEKRKVSISNYHLKTERKALFNRYLRHKIVTDCDHVSRGSCYEIMKVLLSSSLSQQEKYSTDNKKPCQTLSMIGSLVTEPMRTLRRIVNDHLSSESGGEDGTKLHEQYNNRLKQIEIWMVHGYKKHVNDNLKDEEVTHSQEYALAYGTYNHPDWRRRFTNINSSNSSCIYCKEPFFLLDNLKRVDGISKNNEAVEYINDCYDKFEYFMGYVQREVSHHKQKKRRPSSDPRKSYNKNKNNQGQNTTSVNNDEAMIQKDNESGNIDNERDGKQSTPVSKINNNGLSPSTPKTQNNVVDKSLLKEDNDETEENDDSDDSDEGATSTRKSMPSYALNLALTLENYDNYVLESNHEKELKSYSIPSHLFQAGYAWRKPTGITFGKDYFDTYKMDLDEELRSVQNSKEKVYNIEVLQKLVKKYIGTYRFPSEYIIGTYRDTYYPAPLPPPTNTNTYYWKNKMMAKMKENNSSNNHNHSNLVHSKYDNDITCNDNVEQNTINPKDAHEGIDPSLYVRKSTTFWKSQENNDIVKFMEDGIRQTVENNQKISIPGFLLRVKERFRSRNLPAENVIRGKINTIHQKFLRQTNKGKYDNKKQQNSNKLQKKNNNSLDFSQSISTEIVHPAQKGSNYDGSDKDYSTDNSNTMQPLSLQQQPQVIYRNMIPASTPPHHNHDSFNNPLQPQPQMRQQMLPSLSNLSPRVLSPNNSFRDNLHTNENNTTTPEPIRYDNYNYQCYKRNRENSSQESDLLTVDEKRLRRDFRLV